MRAGVGTCICQLDLARKWIGLRQLRRQPSCFRTKRCQMRWVYIMHYSTKNSYLTKSQLPRLSRVQNMFQNSFLKKVLPKKWKFAIPYTKIPPNFCIDICAFAAIKIQESNVQVSILSNCVNCGFFYFSQLLASFVI